MIRPDDFDTTITNSVGGASINVVHIPTGNERSVEDVQSGAIGPTRDSLIVRLKGLLFGPEEIRLDTGRGDGGDFIRVIHLPTGIERSAMRRESTHEELLDKVLEELYANS